VASIYARDKQEAHLINETGLEEGPVDVAASFEQQGADSEVLSELVYGVSEVEGGLAGDDVGDSLLPEHGQIVLWGLFTDHTDEVVAVEITSGHRSLPSVSTEMA